MYNIKITNLDRFVFWFIILDNLFFPYFWIKCVSYSFPFIFFWKIARINVKLPLRNVVFPIALLGGFSAVFGAVLYPMYASDNIVLYANLLSALFSLQLFAYIRENSDNNTIQLIHRVLSLWIVVVFAFAIVFYFDFSMYETLRSFFNSRSGDSDIDTLSRTIRYGYYWSDENNIGYMTCAVFLFVSMSQYISLFFKSLLALMVCVIIIATMSSGALVSLVITMLVFFVTQIIGNNKVTMLSKIIVISAMCFLMVYGLSVLLSSEVYQAFNARLEGKADGVDNRSKIYEYIVKNTEWWKYIICGYGGRTIVGGIYRSPHNGILYMILAYGFIVALKYIKLLFFKVKSQNIKHYLWRIPIFLGFMINIMITEDKIHVLMMMLLAFDSYSRLHYNSSFKIRYEQ